jgi:methionine sulfoxide reductase heme-binding subunit
MSVATSAAPHLFWITSRAAGIVSLVLASLAVSAGLVMSLKMMRAWRPDLLVLHQVLSLGTLIALAVHGGSLLGDHFLSPTLRDIALPFAWSYKTLWTSIGIIGGWALVFLGLSYYARHAIGVKRWRKLHRLRSGFWRCSPSLPSPPFCCLPCATSPRSRPGSRRARRTYAPAAPPVRRTYSPVGWRTTKPENSPPPRAQRVPLSARATVSKRQPATCIHTCPALA